jgi:hypothetical protein
MERRSRLLPFAAPLMVILAGFAVYEYGYERVEEEKASIREVELSKTRILEKYVAIISEKPALEANLSALKEKAKAEDSKIVAGETLSLAAATLGDSVKAVVTGKGGSISSERVEKPEDLGNFKVVNVSLDLILPDARALADVVYSIETRTPYIVIRELDTRVRNFQQPKELMIRLRVAALTRGK